MSVDATGKAEWLARIEGARAMWEALAAAVEEDGWEQPGPAGDWSLKDIAAHLNDWRSLTVSRLEAAAGDKRAPRFPWPEGMSEATEDGVDEINDWFNRRNQGRSATEILAETRDQFRRAQTAVEAIPDDELNVRYSWLEGYPLSEVIAGMLEHQHEDHEPEMRARLAHRLESPENW